MQGYDEGIPRQPSARGCIMPAKNANGAYNVIVWGDSVADALFPSMVVVGESMGLSLRQATKSGCLPLLDVDRVNLRAGSWSAHKCAQFNRALLAELKEGPRPQVAILSGRWSMYTSGSKPIAFLVDKENQTPTLTNSRKVLAHALGKTVDAINALGIHVVLVGQAPEFPGNPNECFARRQIFSQGAGECFKLPRTAADKRLQVSRAILTKVAGARPDAQYLGLEPFLCDDQFCWAKRGNTPLYQQNYHLGLLGARLIGTEMIQRMAPLLAHKAGPTNAAKAKPLGSPEPSARDP